MRKFSPVLAPELYDYSDQIFLNNFSGFVSNCFRFIRSQYVKQILIRSPNAAGIKLLHCRNENVMVREIASFSDNKIRNYKIIYTLISNIDFYYDSMGIAFIIINHFHSIHRFELNILK